ncbi:tetratricopeptide repeat protein [Desulforapulum autotrophicum]|nr:outer membrane protein assembly factor BamD [Desulforapulum autotrophicum]
MALIPSLFFILVVMAVDPTFGSNKGGIYIDADMQYGYAQQCFNSGDPSTALVEFKRFIHFFPEDTRVRQAQFLTGQAYYATKRYEEARKIFETFLFPFSQDPLVIEAYFMVSRTLEQMDKAGQAETVLQNLLLLTDDIATKDRVHASLGWMGLKQSQGMTPLALEKAETHINSLSRSGADTYSRDRVNKTISTIRATKKKSPTLAGLTAIFPGMGFFYCERYQDALVSFVLNTALIMAAHESFERGNPALGGAITFVEAGFYAGNIYGSISSAHKFNLLRNQTNLELLEQAVDPPR